MKKRCTIKNMMLILLSVSLLTMVWSCREDDDDNGNDDGTNTVTSVVTTVNSGTWRITYFNDSGNDETNHFTGYNFTFGANNMLTATNGTNTYTGTWSVTDSNSNDDSIDDLHFNIAFASPNNFEDLSDDWNIIEKTSTVIKLKDVSGGGGGTDYLTFTKN